MSFDLCKIQTHSKFSHLFLVFVTSERIERIPWIAPECVDSGVVVHSATDQWSFGATLLEICNNGELPMSGCSLSEVSTANSSCSTMLRYGHTRCKLSHLCLILFFSQKLCFYQQKCRLPEPPSQDLARFISKCLDYEPSERPSFPIILRDLLSISESSPLLAWFSRRVPV